MSTPAERICHDYDFDSIEDARPFIECAMQCASILKVSTPSDVLHDVRILAMRARDRDTLVRTLRRMLADLAAEARDER